MSLIPLGNRKKKIYFVHQGLSSFVKRDLEILQEHYRVRAIKNFPHTLRKIPQNVLGVIWCDTVFCWFGSPKFLLPVILGRLLRKKVVIVAGGYDVVSLPEIEYGNMRGGFRSWIQKNLFRLANQVICVSKSNMREAIYNAGIPEEKIEMIYHGFEIPKRAAEKKKQMVITVGRVSEENLKRKGIGLFMEVARYFPDVPFVVIGSKDNGVERSIGKTIPKNVILTGYVSEEDLENYLNQAKVYVQASLHEGFGCSVAEAMLHECVPVVSDCSALAEVVAEAGYLFEPGKLDDLKGKLDMALNKNEGMGEKARLRIKRNFGLQARRESLIKLINSI